MARAMSVPNQGRQLVCSICQKQFPEMTLSSCFHTFCLDCLRGQVSSYGGSKYRCPICKTSIELPGEIIRDLNSENYTIEHRGQGHYTDRPSEVCDICAERRMAVNRCLHCEESLCDVCTNAHLTMKASRYHRQHVIPLRSEGRYSADDLYNIKRSRSEKTCWRHRNEEIQFVCKRCDVVLCLICKLMEHENHVTKPISEEAGNIRRTLVSLLQKQVSLGEKLQLKLKEAETKKTQYPLELENELSKLNYQATKLHSEIENEKENVERELRKHYGDYVQKYDTDSKQLMRNYDEYRDMNTEALQLLNDDNDVYVVDKGMFLCKRLQEMENELKKRPEDGHGTPYKRYHYGNLDPDRIQDMMGHVGGRPSHTIMSPQQQLPTERYYSPGEVTPGARSHTSQSASFHSPIPTNRTSKFTVPFSDGLGYVYGIAPVDTSKAWISLLDHSIVMLIDSVGNVITSVDVGDICEDVTGDEEGGCYVTCPRTKAVKHISANEDVETVLSELRQDPHGIAVLQVANREQSTVQRELYVCFTSTRGSTVSLYDNQKGSVRIFDEHGQDLGRSFNLQAPVRIAVHAKSNHLCVSDHSNGCVLISDLSGQYVKAIYTGQKEHDLFKPLGVCFDNRGNVIFADWRGNNVSMIGPDGEFMGTVSQDLDGPQSVAYRGGLLWTGGKHGAVCVKNL